MVSSKRTGGAINGFIEGLQQGNREHVGLPGHFVWHLAHQWAGSSAFMLLSYLCFFFSGSSKRPLLMPVIILHFCKTFRLGLFSTLGVRPAASAWPDHIFPEGLELSKMVKNSGPLGD